MLPSRTLRRSLPIIGVVLAAGLLAAGPAAAQDAQKKPPLSEALRKALDKEKPADVEKRFLATIDAGTLEYDVDAPGLNALGIQYMQDGDMERGTVVMSVAGRAAQLMMEQMMPGMAEAAAAEKAARERERQERAARPTEEEAAAERARAAAGPPRDDLDRFHGIYGSEKDGVQRALFLVRTCDGHLQLGTTWGDVAPWVLRSTGDATFEYPGDSFTKPIHVQVSTDADGKATAIAHDLEFLGNPLQRIADLPAGWQPKCGGTG